MKTYQARTLGLCSVKSIEYMNIENTKVVKNEVFEFCLFFCVQSAIDRNSLKYIKKYFTSIQVLM